MKVDSLKKSRVSNRDDIVRLRGLMAEKLDFVYDIKYRMGSELEDGDG